MKISKLVLLVSLLAAACGTSEEPTSEAGGLSECCTGALAFVAQMPECCRSGVAVAGDLTGCCAEGMLDATPDADRPECCAQSRALMADFSACCEKTLLTGEAGACCEAMPAALLAQKP